jgi:molybdenum cofactor cytidylyltransferase
VSDPDRLFAVIPAAGHSRRMGQPKLLLPLGGTSVIERVLTVLDHPAIAARCVVVRAGDASLAETVRQAGGLVLHPPHDPPDMRTSVSFAIETIQRDFSPREDDGWLLVPADHPVLDRNLIELLIGAWQRDRPLILVPRVGDRRGHPTLFRWSLAREVPNIPEDLGLNWLLSEHASEVSELFVEGEAALTDLDTLEDYERLRRLWG